MKLSSFNAPPLTQSLRAPAIGIAVSAAVHLLFWAFWSAETSESEPPITPAQVIEVALVSAQPAVAPTPPQPEVKPPPLPPPPKPEKPPEKPAPKKPEKPKPKPKPVVKREPNPEPARVAPPAPPVLAAPPAPAPAKVAVPAPQPFVAASYKDASLKNPPTRYPPLALERRWEGRVVLRVQVLPSGSPGDIRVESSSGHEILDNATVDQVKSWHFLPARRGEQAVASWVIVPIEYKLKH